MSDSPDLEKGDFHNEGGEGRRATVQWGTNTLHIQVQADKPVKISNALAHVIPEESLHAKWFVALLHTLGHLAMAADEALKQGLETTADNDDSEEYVEVFWACQRTLNELLGPLKPFVEAVDKFQIQSVLQEDNTIGAALRESLKENHTDAEAEEFLRTLEESLRNEQERIRGERPPTDSEGTYVNPNYYWALQDIATDDRWAEATTVTGDHDRHSATGRVVAEAVARATLDIPYPIAPLGDPNYEWFTPLAVDGLDVEPLYADERGLLAESRYPMTENLFSEYLDYNDVIDLTAYEYTLAEAKNDWVARVFVNIRKALDELAADDGVDVTDLDTDELRARLVQRVHLDGRNPSRLETMREHPTALDDIPNEADLSDDPDTEPLEGDDDLLAKSASPISKVLMAAFERQASFSAVIYHPEADENDHIINWFAEPKEVDSNDYLHVPAEIDNFGDLWEYYFFWDGLRRYLIDEYREGLIEEIATRVESHDTLQQQLTDIDAGETARWSRGAAIGSTLSEVANVTPPDNHSSAGWIDDIHEAQSDPDQTAHIRQTLGTEATTQELARLATMYDIDPTDLSTAEVPCRLCEYQGGSCGDDGCRFETDIERFVDGLPAFLELDRESITS